MVYILLITIGVIFFLVQFDLSKYFVFTDANVYLYYADQLSKGAILYKDLYMTNLPLVPYISILYKSATFGSLHGYYMTACIEALLSAAILFWSLKKMYKNEFIGFIGALFFLTTFVVFSSANHQNGILTAVLLFTIAYLLFLYKKYFIAGIFLGLAFCAKAYIAPIIIALLLFTLIKERKQVLPIFIGIVIATLLTILPSLLYANKEFMNQLFGYSLTRAAGFNKWSIISSFLKYNPVVSLLLLYSLIQWRRLLFPALATLTTTIFLLVYNDLSLLYFTMLAPIAVIILGDIFVQIKKHTPSLNVTIVITCLIIFIHLFILNLYITSINGFMAIPNIDKFISIIQKARPDYLYGEAGIVQGISYLSGIPMLEGISDTNRKMFLSGVLDKNTITEKLKRTRTVIVEYSYNDDLNIATASAIANWGELKNTCKIIHSQDFKMGSPGYKINIVKCY